MLFSTQELIKAPTQSESLPNVLSHEKDQPRKTTEFQEPHRLKTPEEREWEVLQQSSPLWAQESVALAIKEALPQTSKLIHCLSRLQFRAMEQEKSEQILIPEVILKVINNPQAINPLGIMATKYPHLLSQAFEPCQDLANWVEGLMVLSSQEDKIILPYHKTLINKAQQYGYEIARVIKVLTDSGVTITKNLGTTLLEAQKSLIGLHLVLKVLEEQQLTPKLIDVKTVQLLLKYHTVLFHMDRAIRSRFKYAMPSSVGGKRQFEQELTYILATLSQYQPKGFYMLNAICQIWSYSPQLLSHPHVMPRLTELSNVQHITVAKNMLVSCCHVSPELLTSQNCENIFKKSQYSHSLFPVVQKIRKQWEKCYTRAVFEEILAGEHDEAVVDSLKYYHGTLNEQEILEVLRGQKTLNKFESYPFILFSDLSSSSCDSLTTHSTSSDQTDCCRKRAHGDDGLNLGMQIAGLTPSFNNEQSEKDYSSERNGARAVIKKVRK